ncbi:MAG TPA: CRTAC1 family protein [Gemmataceae bacterium]|nr:CRTAC1 family protein [Gemmataceae bacterium]
MRRVWAVTGAGVVSAALVTGLACSPKSGGGPAPAVAEQPAPDLRGPDLFEDVTSATGITFTYRNGEDTSPHLSILESLGGGVAAIDYDRDGNIDLFFPGGGYFDGPEKKEIKGHPCKLFKNLGDFKFKDVTEEVGLHTLADGQPWFYTHGAAVGDYDRDGWPDLLVTGWGRVALFHNVAGRRFEDVSTPAGLARGITWATSAAFADLDNDRYPDLYVCQYVDWSFANHPTDCNYDGKTPDVCPPKRFSGLRHKVYRNHGNGTFQEFTDEAGLRKGAPDASKGLGVVVLDVNGDGKSDVYVANDTVDNFLYLNESSPGRIRFREVGAIAGVARDGGGGANGSMGLDTGDPEGTGKPYLWVTNYEKELHALYKNESDKDGALFTFHSNAAGIGAIGQAFVGWGTGFIDLDNHGWEDIFVTNGHAIRYPTGTTRLQKPVLLRNKGEGQFQDITPRGGPYFRKEHLGRGAVLTDLDNDGKVDIVVSHMNEPVAILKNVSKEPNHWLGIELTGKDRGDVVGAKVVVEAGGRKQTRFAKGGGSYASAPDKRLVFGLGATDKIDKLTVTWPGGAEQTWTELKPDQYHRLGEGEKEAKGK